jgi:flagellar basal body-associated protein FliL|tara:strand:- start:501 stop:698 length:198 start_codon:yes stop_codon:yes gene_type:complete
MPEQLELQLNKTKEATPEEQEEWINEQIEKYGKHQLRFVAFMSVVQVLTVVMMLLAFWVISHVVE